MPVRYRASLLGKRNDVFAAHGLYAARIAGPAIKSAIFKIDIGGTGLCFCAARLQKKGHHHQQAANQPQPYMVFAFAQHLHVLKR